MAEAKKLSRQALLRMAKDWKGEEKVQTAIKAYEAVIEAAPESGEAEGAKAALLEIAREYEKGGKKNSALHLFKKVAFAKYARGY